ncbi:MAG TPA: PQQ-binding-like beta-propeller repeat protein, partial [Rhodanobacteraceae bacterium]|nr:PQQ-binding-like beta-propeller repeat protein [Rhodanobacteraceae bacterium]
AIETPSGTKDLVFVNAQNGRLTAYDAADGSVVWSKDTPGGHTPIESAAAIDPNREFVYSYGADGNAHKYAIGDGTEITSGGWPQVATLKPNVEKGASAIAWGISGDTTYLYVVNNGYVGDGGDYQGHITTIDLTDGSQKVFNTLCSDITIHMIQNGQPGTTDCGSRQNGIWGRPGATFDPVTDRVYITTGNGPYNADTGGLNWGDSVLALNADGTGKGAGFPADAYAPLDVDSLQSGDVDLGSGSLTILKAPAGSVYPHIGVETGKDSRLHLINLDDMSGTGSPGPLGGAIEVIDVPVSEFWMKTQTATWVDTDGTAWVFVGNGNGLSGLKLQLDGSNVPFLQPTWTKSADATSTIIANGIVYHIGGCSGGDCLYARDPHTGEVLWTSPTLGGSVKWQSPILVNGALYVATSNRLNRFDLGGGGGTTHVVTPTAGPNGSIAPSTPQTVDEGDTTAFTVTPNAHYRIASVTGCGGQLNGNTYTTGPITADCTVSATFAAITHTVTPHAGANGSIDPDTPQTVDDGDTTTFTITPDAHYRIASVTGCGGSLAGDTYTTGAITADCTVNATFEIMTHTVTPDAGNGSEGTIAPATPQTVDDGDTVAFTITPVAPYMIASVAGCGGKLDGNVYTTAPVLADCEVSASFAIDPDPVFEDGFDGGPQ